MKNLFTLLEGFYFHCLDIRFYPSDTIQMPYWIGAVLRNRFLFAASQVKGSEGKTLLEWLDELPIPENHPCYKILTGGFPKGYWFDCTTLPSGHKDFTLEKERIYTFSLMIVGNLNRLVPLFMEAIQKMCDDGLGYPLIPLSLIDIRERGGSLIYAGEGMPCRPLSHPVKWHYAGTPAGRDLSLTLRLKTPVSLVSRNRKAKGSQGYQSRMNQFPSFYQFMRSVVYRLLTLNMLYINADAVASAEEIEAFVSDATDAQLLRANIRYVTRNSTPRKGSDHVYTMGGYCGLLSFGQVANHYIPLLLLGSFTGVGNDINYGLGQFEVNY